MEYLDVIRDVRNTLLSIYTHLKHVGAFNNMIIRSERVEYYLLRCIDQLGITIQDLSDGSDNDDPKIKDTIL